MIKLFGFGPRFGLADSSPFVLKVETYMRMAGITFEVVADFANLRKAPKGKLPFIEDDGKVIADSFFIISYLREKYRPTLDDHLSPEQKAVSNLIVKSLEENFYWCIVYSRWMRDDTWPTIKNAIFGQLPFPLNLFVPYIVKKGVKDTLYKQGLGRHNDEEILCIARHALESLSILLADKKYFFGDKPSTLDAVAYAFLAQLMLVDLDNPMNRLARSFENLVNFCKTIDGLYSRTSK
ncbi:MAG: glutathione S-transferase family protein [Gammaproteobacteria bacterium]